MRQRKNRHKAKVQRDGSRDDEILEIIAKYGYPQDWNNNGEFGPERYIEAHIWSDDVIRRYI